jgi:1-acyl-sn-glycerol-3-phosphate acyltransferase
MRESQTGWEQNLFFAFLRRAIRLFTKPMKTRFAAPVGDGPAVFVCNHDRAWGPIAMCVHFELCRELRPWINADALSPSRLPNYARNDFWWPRDRWYTKIFDYSLAYIIALILPPILRSSACIPVHHDARVMTTLKSSADAIKHGYHILLFPEHPTGFAAYGAEVFTGFTSLGRLIHRRLGRAVQFYPTFVDWKGKEIRVGAPITYDTDGSHKDQAAEISAAVEEFFSRRGQ